MLPDELFKWLTVLSLVIAIVSPLVLSWRARISGDATSLANSDERTKDVATLAHALEALTERLTLHESSLQEFRIEAARNFVHRPEIERLETRVLEAIHGVSERLDRVLERRQSGTH